MTTIDKTEDSPPWRDCNLYESECKTKGRCIGHSRSDKTEDGELRDKLASLILPRERTFMTVERRFSGRDIDVIVSFISDYATTKAEQLAADIMEGLKGLEIDLQATEKHIESTGLTGDKVAERMLQVEIEADDRKDVLDDVRSLVQKLREAPNV